MRPLLVFVSGEAAGAVLLVTYVQPLASGHLLESCYLPELTLHHIAS